MYNEQICEKGDGRRGGGGVKELMSRKKNEIKKM